MSTTTNPSVQSADYSGFNASLSNATSDISVLVSTWLTTTLTYVSQDVYYFPSEKFPVTFRGQIIHICNTTTGTITIRIPSNASVNNSGTVVKAGEQFTISKLDGASFLLVSDNYWTKFATYPV
ncbi:MAG: hypothetical protein ACOVRN_10295 [Flavobacterium sp.]